MTEADHVSRAGVGQELTADVGQEFTAGNGPRLESADIPVQPFRTRLYDHSELLGSFDANDETSYSSTLDFVTYRTYVLNGRNRTVPHFHSIARAIHDNSITQALGSFTAGRKLAAIMGGHKLSRGSETYATIVVLAKRLAEAGITVASGGGPGAMEATHVGAGLANQADSAVERTLSILGTEPEFPKGVASLVRDDGTIADDVLRRLHRWQVPAFEVARGMAPGAHSLAVPTWHYGHEPPTPIASHIAKYYENSIREDGLLAMATHGIVFAEGRAGTMQEIFQDAAQNYYRSYGWFSPMVLLGCDYWQKQFPVEPVLRALFRDHEDAHLTVTDDVDEAVETILSFQPASG